MMKVVNNYIQRFPLPGGGYYEYDINTLARVLYGRIYDANGRKLATARQAIWPWTKLLTPEEMFQKVKEKL